jgi:hypothetical protein
VLFDYLEVGRDRVDYFPEFVNKQNQQSILRPLKPHIYRNLLPTIMGNIRNNFASREARGFILFFEGALDLFKNCSGSYFRLRDQSEQQHHSTKNFI